MILARPQVIPPTVQRCLDAFNSRLASSGAKRGMWAAKKSATEGDLFVYDVIGEDFWTGKGVTAQDVAVQLDELKGVSKLNVYINSPGGDLYEGKTIFSQLSRFGTERFVHVDGIAASAASLIAMAGTRITSEAGATWLVHRVSSGAWGFSEVLRKAADEIDIETNAITGIYAQRTKRSADEIGAWMREDKIMDAATAKARGFTDEIAESDQSTADGVAAAAAARAGGPVSPRAMADNARALARTLSEKFAAASRGLDPGKPGNVAAKTPVPRQKGKSQ